MRAVSELWSSTGRSGYQGHTKQIAPLDQQGLSGSHAFTITNSHRRSRAPDARLKAFQLGRRGTLHRSMNEPSGGLRAA